MALLAGQTVGGNIGLDGAEDIPAARSDVEVAQALRCVRTRINKWAEMNHRTPQKAG